MDPITLIATSAVTLLSPYLAKAGEKFAEGAGSAAWDKTKELYEAIHAHFEGRPDGTQALADLQNAPDDPDNQADVRKRLKNAMAEDDDFKQKLDALVKEADHAAGSNYLDAHITGGVGTFNQVGTNPGVINIGASSKTVPASET